MLPHPRLHPGNTPPRPSPSRARTIRRGWHLSPADWERTLRRHAEMSAHGIIVLHFTPGQIRREPERVLAAIRKALASAAGRPPLDVRTVPAS